MNIRTCLGRYARAAVAVIAVLAGADKVLAQQQAKTGAGATAPSSATISDSLSAPSALSAENPQSSLEQGHTHLSESFNEGREWRLEKRRKALEDTQFDINFRSFYFDRKKFDGSESQAWAIGGWAGLKTGYFFDHLSVGATVYTSQTLYGDKEKDGTLLLKPGQQGYTVLGEAYADLRIIDDLNLYVGRKGYDTPFINRNDVRMTPNTFEAIVLQGKISFGADEGQASPGTHDGKASHDAKPSSSANGATLKYGIGYFDQIKERNSDQFVPMSKDAGASVDRGVYTAGARYEKGNFMIGGIDYYCPDVINIGYAEATLKVPINADWQPKFSAQFVDQRSVGSDSLTGDGFSGQQFGLKAELPVKKALFTTGFTHTTGGTDMQSPWGGYPGYTSVQVQDFDRAGESAFLLRAGYEFTDIKGLSTYALAVLGTNPSGDGQYRQNEYDLNLQWAPPEGVLKGLSVRVRYALVDQFGGTTANNLQDFRVILNYGVKF